jgi:hypothetical protein
MKEKKEWRGEGEGKQNRVEKRKRKTRKRRRMNEIAAKKREKGRKKEEP